MSPVSDGSARRFRLLPFVRTRAKRLVTCGGGDGRGVGIGMIGGIIGGVGGMLGMIGGIAEVGC